MNVKKLLLLMVLLALVGTMVGCHEEHARRSNLTQDREVVWEQTVTGFWHPRVAHTDLDYTAREFDQK